MQQHSSAPKFSTTLFKLLYGFRYLYDQSKHLHWQNYILINAKMKLGLLYGNIKPYTYENLTRSQLERKRQVCQDVLDTMSKVDTGYTSWRTSMLSEITKTKILLYSHVSNRR